MKNVVTAAHRSTVDWGKQPNSLEPTRKHTNKQFRMFCCFDVTLMNLKSISNYTSYCIYNPFAYLTSFVIFSQRYYYWIPIFKAEIDIENIICVWYIFLLFFFFFSLVFWAFSLLWINIWNITWVMLWLG